MKENCKHSHGQFIGKSSNAPWPNLKTLELEVDWKKHELGLSSMLRAELQHLEFLGPQSGDSEYIARNILPALFRPSLVSIHIGSDVIEPQDPIHHQVLLDLLDTAPSISDVRIMNASFSGKDVIFQTLSQRLGLEALEIDLEPGLQLLPCITGPNALPSLFISLRRLHVMCYPEIAIALLPHLQLIQDLHLDVARIPTDVQQDRDPNTLNDIIGVLQQCKQLQSLQVNIGQLAIDFPSATAWPTLSGTALTELAFNCPKLQNINLFASAPGAIDGSNISSAQFEVFCKGVPELSSLSLKFDPQTAIDLEFTALRSLGKNCPKLEALRLKIACHLPDLQIAMDSPSLQPTEPVSQHPIDLEDGPLTSRIAVKGTQREASPDIRDLVRSKTDSAPLFQNLKHLGFARPQSILSIASDTYILSSSPQSGSIMDPFVEQSLVHSWAHPLAAQFPHLEILEAWGDWTGQDNETLNYFLPREALLATTWEFLSGVEQDLWDEEDRNQIGNADWHDNYTDRYSIDSHTSIDWDLASLVNEFRVQQDFDDHPSLDTYEEEPEDMLTPGRVLDKEEGPFFGHANSQDISASRTAVMSKPEAVACSV